MNFITDITSVDVCKICFIILFFICFVAYIFEFLNKYKIHKNGKTEIIIVLIIGGVFTYAFGIIKIYLIIVLPLIWLAAKIKRLI